MCRLITGAVKRKCLRIAIPLKFQEDPEFVSRLQETLRDLAALSDPNCPEVIDSDYGDYSLMVGLSLKKYTLFTFFQDFDGDGVRLCHQPRNGPKFPSSKHAARYYNQLNANRLWEYLNVSKDLSGFLNGWPSADPLWELHECYFTLEDPHRQELCIPVPWWRQPMPRRHPLDSRGRAQRSCVHPSKKADHSTAGIQIHPYS